MIPGLHVHLTAFDYCNHPVPPVELVSTAMRPNDGEQYHVVSAIRWGLGCELRQCAEMLRRPAAPDRPMLERGVTAIRHALLEFGKPSFDHGVSTWEALELRVVSRQGSSETHVAIARIFPSREGSFLYLVEDEEGMRSAEVWRSTAYNDDVCDYVLRAMLKLDYATNATPGLCEK